MSAGRKVCMICVYYQRGIQLNDLIQALIDPIDELQKILGACAIFAT